MRSFSHSPLVEQSCNFLSMVRISDGCTCTKYVPSAQLRGRRAWMLNHITKCSVNSRLFSSSVRLLLLPFHSLSNPFTFPLVRALDLAQTGERRRIPGRKRWIAYCVQHEKERERERRVLLQNTNDNDDLGSPNTYSLAERKGGSCHWWFWERFIVAKNIIHSSFKARNRLSCGFKQRKRSDKNANTIKVDLVYSGILSVSNVVALVCWYWCKKCVRTFCGFHQTNTETPVLCISSNHWPQSSDTMSTVIKQVHILTLPTQLLKWVSFSSIRTDVLWKLLNSLKCETCEKKW